MTKPHDIRRQQDRRLGELMAILFEGFATLTHVSDSSMQAAILNTRHQV